MPWAARQVGRLSSAHRAGPGCGESARPGPARGGAEPPERGGLERRCPDGVRV